MSDPKVGPWLFQGIKGRVISPVKEVHADYILKPNLGPTLGSDPDFLDFM